jgi:hypothetical protein
MVRANFARERADFMTAPRWMRLLLGPVIVLGVLGSVGFAVLLVIVITVGFAMIGIELLER